MLIVTVPRRQQATHVASQDRMGSSGADRAGRPTRVLYVEVNEDGTVGGSHQALYDLLEAEVVRRRRD